MAEPLRLLIVDDEPPARARLRRLLQAQPGVQVVGEADSGLQALALADALRPDALLLDVQMPELGGLDVAASLPDRAQGGPAVVFVTAYDAYALPAFDAAAVDYLLKPVDPARLARARAQELPYPANTFAAVISTFPTEFIADPATLSEVRRVLRPGAPLIVVPTATFTSGGAGKTALGWAYRATGQHDAAPGRHDRIAALFEPHGFTVGIFEEPCPRSLALVVVARKSP